MGSVPDIGKIIGDFMEVVIKFFDNAFQQGWLWMFLGGIILFVIIIMMYGS